MSTLTDPAIETKPQTSHGEPGDHERLSHYVEKGALGEGYVFGKQVRALCGKVWVPSRDPNNFPVCPECKEIYEGMDDSGSGDDSQG